LAAHDIDFCLIFSHVIMLKCLSLVSQNNTDWSPFHFTFELHWDYFSYFFILFVCDSCSNVW